MWQYQNKNNNLSLSTQNCFPFSVPTVAIAMAASVNILKVGYSELHLESNIMKVNCTCSLILEDKYKIIVDVLTAWDASFLKEALKEKGFDPEDITHVVCTHGHSDHIGNLNLFTNALHIVGQSVSEKDRISENIEVISSPGHTLSDVSVIVKGTSFGTVAIVGDLFEREEDIQYPDLWKETAGSENPSLQYKNRQIVLELADYIIPGHGPGFYVTDDLRKYHYDQFIKHNVL